MVDNPSQTPRWGQIEDPHGWAHCSNHPQLRAISVCKRCDRPICDQCAINTEVGVICPRCAQQSTRARHFASSQLGLTKALVYFTIAVSLVGIVHSYLTSGLSIKALLAYVPVLATDRPWLLVTSAFVHAGLIHLAFNMMALWVVGNPLERLFGPVRFASLYFTSIVGGVVGVLLYALWDPTILLHAMVGASGGIFGLFGAFFVVLRRLGQDTRSVLTLLVVNLALGFIVPGIAWQAHVGGMIVGALAAALLLRTMGRGRDAKTERRWRLGVSIGLFVLVFAGTWIAQNALVWANFI